MSSILFRSMPISKNHSVISTGDQIAYRMQHKCPSYQCNCDPLSKSIRVDIPSRKNRHHTNGIRLCRSTGRLQQNKAIGLSDDRALSSAISAATLCTSLSPVHNLRTSMHQQSSELGSTEYRSKFDGGSNRRFSGCNIDSNFDQLDRDLIRIQHSFWLAIGACTTL